MTLSVWSAAADAPDATALIGDHGASSYAELAASAARALGWLERQGLEAPVALVPEIDESSVVLLHALIAAGRPAILMHPRLTPEERAALLATAGPACLVEREAWRSGVSVSVPASTVPDDERPLAVTFTSGTTRSAKGVVLSRRAFVAAARASASNLPLGSDDRWLLCLPLAHVGGLSVLTRCLLARAAVVLGTPAPGENRVSARRLARLIERHDVSVVSLVPPQLHGLLALEPAWQPPLGLRALLLGGAAANRGLLEQAADRGWPVLTTYGLSEACSQVATQPLGTINRGDLGAGRPLPGVELRIVDGTIRLRGPTLFSGYWRSDQPALDPGGWFDTGDLGRLDVSGMLHVDGRRDDLIVTGGENVSPAEIEALLESHPDVAEACVFGVADPVWGQLVAAAVVPRADHRLELEQLASLTARRLAGHKQPRRWYVLAALERHASGKLDRRATAQRAQSELARRAEGPASPKLGR